MLKNIPKILSPELLSALCEMGHADTIVLGDGNFAGSTFAKQGKCKLIRADGIGVSALLDAILQLVPCDYSATPIMLMKPDRDVKVGIWDEYKAIVAKHEPRGTTVIGYYERFDFYEAARKAYCIVQTGEEAIYANVIIQKGVIE